MFAMRNGKVYDCNTKWNFMVKMKTFFIINVWFGKSTKKIYHAVSRSNSSWDSKGLLLGRRITARCKYLTVLRWFGLIVLHGMTHIIGNRGNLAR